MPIENSPFGFVVSGEVGLRFRGRFSVGLQLGIGRFGGTYPIRVRGIEVDRASFSVVPIDTAAYLHMQPLANFWGGLLAGVHVDGTAFDAERTWTRDVGIGLEAGYEERLSLGPHSLAVVARATASYGSDVSFGTLALGIAYHH